MTGTNATIEKFGHPVTLIADYAHWVVLLRPAAPTLGALIMAAKGDVTSYAALPDAAFTEQARVVRDIESALARTVKPERINYLMLMMVDPHVHLHVIPRYAGERTLGQCTLTDAGWPKLPDLGAANMLNDADREALKAWLIAAWQRSD